MTVTLISGASSGVGRSLALRMARDGDDIAVVSRCHQLLDSLVAMITASGARALAIAADVTDRQSIHHAVAATEARLGPIERLVVHAGEGSPTRVENFSAEQVAECLAVNVTGVANCIEAVLGPMLERGEGHIVALSRLGALRGVPRAEAASAARGALASLIESLRIDLEPLGIDVTLLVPGSVRNLCDTRRRPFQVDLDRATEILWQAIRKRKRVCSFPWHLTLAAGLARCLPAALYDRLARRLI